MLGVFTPSLRDFLVPDDKMNSTLDSSSSPAGGTEGRAESLPSTPLGAAMTVDNRSVHKGEWSSRGIAKKTYSLTSLEMFVLCDF